MRFRVTLALLLLSSTAHAQWALSNPQSANPVQAQDLYGFSVAVSSVGAPRVIVGAPGRFAEVRLASAAAANGNTAIEARLLSGTVDDNFGVAVAIGSNPDGAFAAVGANADDIPIFNAGRVHTYVMRAGAWQPLAQLAAPNPSSTGNFGTALSIEGDLLAVGEPKFRRLSDNVEVGAVHIYRRAPEPGTWQFQQTIEGTQALARFGQAVRLRSGRLAISAVLEDDTVGGVNDVGAAYVYVENNVMFSFEQRLLAGDRMLADRMGIAIDLEGDVMVVGAGNDDKVAGADAGSAYVFRRENGVWVEAQKLRSTAPQASERFGQAIALQNNRVVIGAYCLAPVCAGPGAAYVFRPGPGGFELEQRLSPNGMGESFGHALAFGSGFLAVGAFNYSASSSGAGALYIAFEQLFRNGFEQGR
jgi:hypothetical protein